MSSCQMYNKGIDCITPAPKLKIAA